MQVLKGQDNLGSVEARMGLTDGDKERRGWVSEMGEMDAGIAIPAAPARPGTVPQVGLWSCLQPR